MAESRTYKRSLGEVFEASVRALKNSGFEVTEKGTHTIKASSGITLRSWGEVIQIELSSTAEGVKVNITSEPKAQLFDLGKSAENVRKIFSELSKKLGE
jgi:hypothetical protein